MNYYTINEVSEFTFVTVYTLSYYDQIGLLKPGHITANGHRFYTDADIMRLQQVIALQHTGLSLMQVKLLLNSEENSEKQRAETITYVSSSHQDFENHFDSMLSFDETNLSAESESYPNSDELSEYVKASKKNTKTYWVEYVKRWDMIYAAINDYLSNNSENSTELTSSKNWQSFLKEISQDIKHENEEIFYSNMVKAIKKYNLLKNH